jgi:hypothetical protein
MSDSATSSSPIRLALHSVDGLLDAEGSPLAEPRLHPEFAHAVWSEALQSKSTSGFHLELTVPIADSHRQAEVAEAVRFHFQNRQSAFGEELRALFQDGRRSLVIGLLVVALLLTLAEAIPYLWERRLAYAVSESLIIVAWVVLWHPAELLLYAHFPVRRHRKLAGALAEARVALTAAK